MSQTIIPNNSISCRPIFAGLFFSTLLLVACSFAQKVLAGYNPFLPKGYIVPILFGSVSGALLGAYFQKIKMLNNALAERLDGLEAILPICSHCKKIRKPEADPRDPEAWVQLETYISMKTNSFFSHGLCPDCYQPVEKRAKAAHGRAAELRRL